MSVLLLLRKHPSPTVFAFAEGYDPDCAVPYGIMNVADFDTLGQHYTSPPKPYSPAVDINADNLVNLVDFAYYGAHAGHSSSHGPINTPSEMAQSNATVALQFTEEFPTATTHRLYVEVGVENFAGVRTAIFSIYDGNDRVAFVGWEPAGGTIGEVLFSPVVRDELPQLFFGVRVSDAFTGSSAHLGRLVFDVAGVEPIQIEEDEFVLTIAEVLLETAGEGPVTAQMGGTVDRSVDPVVARIYHNRLEQNFPNPFNPTTTLAFSIKQAVQVNLTIYDVVGRRVRELVDERRERGAYKVVWDGQNDAGQVVASGVYFYKLVAGSFTDTKKMTILK